MRSVSHPCAASNIVVSNFFINIFFFIIIELNIKSLCRCNIFNKFPRKGSNKCRLTNGTPPTIGMQMGRLSLSASLCPQLGHSASRSLRPLKNAVGSFSPQLQVLFKIPYTPGVRFVCFVPHFGQKSIFYLSAGIPLLINMPGLIPSIKIVSDSIFPHIL